MKNTLKEKLTLSQKPIGTFFELGSPTVMEALGQTGLDFIILDNEHGPFEAESSCNFVRAAEAVGLTAIARIREISRPAVLKLLDVGVQGLIAPDIHTAEQVQQLVEYAKYFPIGKRGFCPSRKDGWGFDEIGQKSVSDQMEHWNKEVLVIPQCETVGALEQIEAIVALDGVDGIFIGPFDLSISMGIPGQFEHPDFIAALEQVKLACKKAQKFCMIFAGNPDAAAERLRQGYDAVAYALDASVLISAFKRDLSTIKENLSSTK